MHGPSPPSRPSAPPESPLGDLRDAPLASAAAAAVLCVLVALAFRGTLANGFVNFDDPVYVTSNPRLRALTAENLRWMLTDTGTFYWQPLTWLWHAAEIAAFGMDAARHHATSVALHAAGTLALFALTLALLRLTAARRGSDEAATDRVLLAAAATLLFAIHPLRVESVAWASQKKDLLAALLFAAALLAWVLRCAATDPRARRRRGGAVLMLLVLGLAAKPMAMALPAALLVLDAYPLGRWRGRADTIPLLREKIPHVALVVLALLPSVIAPRQATLLPTGTTVVPAERAAEVAHGTASPLVRTALPRDLVAYVPAPRPGEPSFARAPWGTSALLLAGIGAACVALAARGTVAPAAAFAFYLVAVAPVSGLRRSGALATADRFALVPTMALVPLAAGGGLALLARARRRSAAATAVTGVGLAAAAAGLAAGLGAATAVQVRTWRDSVTLWEPVVARYGERALPPVLNLAIGLAERAHATRDVALLEKAVGHLARAEAAFPHEPRVLVNRGILELQAGRPERAASYLLRVEKLDPSNALAQAHLAGAEAELGRPDAAAERLARARAMAARVPVPEELARFVSERIAAARARAAPEGVAR